MPPVGAALMAAGEFAIGAVSSITLSGLATGASIVGAGLQVVGGITGSKTLQKIGTGFSIAGGAGFAANALRGATSITGGISKTGGLLQADNIDDILSQPLKGSKLAAAKNTQGFNKIDFAESGSSLTAADSFKSNAGKVGSGVNFDPEIEKSFWQRASSTITGYDPTLNMLGVS